ncbi:hypothetical protein LTR36_007878 [Oleoguttula mirabilis]|uniref:Uncharacterized protein n=1 Tax=Oleoguttula mirabilis TaxID=1507867 RepID=A0AAV9J9C5_9PEZI|nr:hypothetical protein LTR36_007878 [Oleoguttula mirabilis]
MQLKDKLMRRGSSLDVGGNASAQSSSTTVDSVGARRLSAVRERDNQAIDIERAIALLQELKKTASPNELVALHRALLPTKDVETVSSPQAATFDERPAYSPAPTFQRRSSVLPPGLATRGGFAEDLLRKQADGLVESQKPKGGRPPGWGHHTASTSVSSLAALDLARDEDGGLPGGRPVTPSDFAYSHTGLYEHGTLRITNGAASPEPSIATAISHDRLGDESKADDGYYTCSSGRPSLEAVRGRASIDILPGRNVSQDSLPIRDRIMNSDKAQQQRKQRSSRLSGISSASEESLVSHIPLQVNPTEPRQSVDRRSVSPMSDAPMARFQQRWSHRASHISAEYVTDCDIAGSPYEEKNNTILNLATRLSTVYDSDGAGDTNAGLGSPEAALSKLNGATEYFGIGHAAEIGSARTSDEQIRPPQVAQASRPLAPRKVDSGYGSDASFRFSQRKGSGEAGPGRNPYLGPIEALKNVEEIDETSSIADTQSLYTFEEILNSPSLLSEGATTPSPKSSKGKKSSTLLRLHTMKSEKKSSLPAMPEPVTQDSSDNISNLASTQSSPGDSKQNAAQQQKRLQKPMPQAVKNQRKEEMRKLKEASAVSLPVVPDDMSAAHAQRLEELPTGGALARTYATVGTTDSQEDLDRTPPVELVGDIKFPSPAPSLAETKSSSSRFSKSRGRKRSNSVRQGSSAEDSPEVRRSWSLGKLRSKSQSRSRSQSHKRSSFDIVMGRSLVAAEQEEPAVSPGDENVPAYTDFSSVARTLGSGSYDISTNQIKRATAPVPGAMQHQLQSPWMISTGLIKSKSMKGMNSEVASELARMKSRDFAHRDREPWQERPRMVFAPRSKDKKTRSASSEASCPTVSVEDRFPEWQGKPASRETSPQRPQVLHRAHSMYAENIPPMPELPADVEIKSSRADGIVAKKLRDSARTSPGASARSSAEAPHGKSATAKKSSMQSSKQAQANQVDDKTLGLLHPVERPAAAKRAHTINVQVRELNGSSSELSSAASAEEQAIDEEEPVASPTHNARHSGWPGWEHQAKLWRQRRESMGETLGKPVEDDALPTADSPPISRKPSMEPVKSPAIVVSRYITPLGSENVARANAGQRPTDAAARHADAYRGLIVDDKENRPAKQDVPRTDSAASAATTNTFVTVKSWDPRPAKQDVPRTESAISAKTYQSTTSVVTTTSTANSSRSPMGRQNHTPSGNFTPYSPTQSAAERSRALSLAKLNGAASPNESTLSLGWLSGSPANASTSTLGSPRGPRPRSSNPQALTDRYSGGLGYGWERGVGFNGSAGTRSSGSEAKRKSVQMSEDFGLDLSDVPVFLQKVR